MKEESFRKADVYGAVVELSRENEIKSGACFPSITQLVAHPETYILRLSKPYSLHLRPYNLF
jgi:hypothetical protein